MDYYNQFNDEEQDYNNNYKFDPKKDKIGFLKNKISVPNDTLFELELFQENLNNYDVFLLGPQVRFKKDDFQKVASTVGKKVEIINQMDYGMLKGEKILDWALTLF